MINLGTFGGTNGCAFLVNKHGQVTGQSNLPGDQVTHGFFWERGVLRDLGNFGGDVVEPFWINDVGQVVGTAEYTGNTIRHAFLWKRGVMTDLGTVYPKCSSKVTGSVALDINSEGQIVGTSWCDNTAAAAFLWEHGGPMIDLNTLIPANSSLQLVGASNINDRGEIVGLGSLPATGDVHAFLLIPCDENHGDNNNEDCECNQDHPNDEGCENAAAGASAATCVSPAFSMQRPTANQSNPGFLGPSGPMLRPFGRRLMPWYRSLDTHYPKTPEQH